MFIDDMIAVLQEFRKKYPHRHIEVRGELLAKAKDGEPHECLNLVCPPIEKNDKT